eukprot:SAG31_NODE_6822_length_1877_cov_3.763217_1_plen_392_part_00
MKISISVGFGYAVPPGRQVPRRRSPPRNTDFLCTLPPQVRCPFRPPVRQPGPRLSSQHMPAGPVNDVPQAVSAFLSGAPGPELTQLCKLLRLRKPNDIASRRKRLEQAKTSHPGLVWAAICLHQDAAAFDHVRALLPTGATATSIPVSTVDVHVDTADRSHPVFTAGSSGAPTSLTQTGGSAPAPAPGPAAGPAPVPDLASIAADMAAMRKELAEARAAAAAAPSAADIERRVEIQLQAEINKINSGFSSRLLTAPKLDKAEQRKAKQYSMPTNTRISSWQRGAEFTSNILRDPADPSLVAEPFQPSLVGPISRDTLRTLVFKNQMEATDVERVKAAGVFPDVWSHAPTLTPLEKTTLGPQRFAKDDALRKQQNVFCTCQQIRWGVFAYRR